MSEHDKKVAGVEATANPMLSTGRRRLVKGAMLATPAVMTLMSGRLAATASMACENGALKLDQSFFVTVMQNGQTITYEFKIDSSGTVQVYSSNTWVDATDDQKTIAQNGQVAGFGSCLTSINPSQGT